MPACLSVPYMNVAVGRHRVCGRHRAPRCANVVIRWFLTCVEKLIKRRFVVKRPPSQLSFRSSFAAPPSSDSDQTRPDQTTPLEYVPHQISHFSSESYPFFTLKSLDQPITSKAFDPITITRGSYPSSYTSLARPKPTQNPINHDGTLRHGTTRAQQGSTEESRRSCRVPRHQSAPRDTEQAAQGEYARLNTFLSEFLPKLVVMDLSNPTVIVGDAGRQARRLQQVPGAPSHAASRPALHASRPVTAPDDDHDRGTAGP